MRKTSQALAVETVFGETGTALQRLRTATGADAQGRHDKYVEHVGTILALALANQPAAGFGNPADWKQIERAFADGKLTRYATACCGLAAALKGKTRSIPEWDDARVEGLAMAQAMLADLRPKSYTKAELAAKEAKSAEKKAEREKEAKLAEVAAQAETQKALADAREAGIAEGRASVPAPVITAEMVADMVRSGVFSLEGLIAISDAISSAMAPAGEAVTA